MLTKPDKIAMWVALVANVIFALCFAPELYGSFERAHHLIQSIIILGSMLAAVVALFVLHEKIEESIKSK